MAFPIMAITKIEKKPILISIYNELTSEKVRHCLELGDIVLLVAAVLLYIHTQLCKSKRKTLVFSE